MCCILLSFSIGSLIWYTKAGRSKIESQFHFWAKSVPREVFDPQSAFLCRKGWKKGDSYCLANVAPIFFLELIRSSWEFRVPLLIKQTLPWKCFFLGKQKGLLYYLVQYRNWLFFCWLPAKSRGNINGVLGIPRLPPPLEAHLYLDWHQYTSIPFLKGEWPQEEPQEHIFCIVVACLSHDL